MALSGITNVASSLRLTLQCLLPNGSAWTLSKMFKLLLTLLLHPFCVNSIQINERNLNDIKAITGSKVEVVCQVDDLRDPLEDCEFYAPNGKRFRSRSRNNRDNRNNRRRDRDDIEDDEDSRHSGQNYQFF